MRAAAAPDPEGQSLNNPMDRAGISMRTLNGKSHNQLSNRQLAIGHDQLPAPLFGCRSSNGPL
jgi:hypothetical protein